MRKVKIIDDFYQMNYYSNFPNTEKVFIEYNNQVAPSFQLDIQSIKQIYTSNLSKLKSSNFSTVPYPHLKNILIPLFFPFKSQEISDIYTLYLLISNDIEMLKITNTYYKQIISFNNYGIPKELFIGSMNELNEQNKNYYYKLIDTLSTWYTKSEFVMLNISLLNKFFSHKLFESFSEDINSYKEFNNNVGVLSKKNILFFAYKVINFYNNVVKEYLDDDENIDPRDIPKILKNLITKGIYYTGLLPESFREYIIDFIKEKITDKIFDNGETFLKKTSKDVMIKDMIKQIDKMIKHLDYLNNKVLYLIDLEINLFIKNKIIEIDNVQKNNNRSELISSVGIIIDDTIKEIKNDLGTLSLKGYEDFVIINELEDNYFDDYVILDYK